MESRRRKEGDDGTASGEPGNFNPRSGSKESMKKTAAAASMAAARRRAEAGEGISAKLSRVYRRADEVVSMPFLIILGFVLAGLVYYDNLPGTLPEDPGEGGEVVSQWAWLQGKVREPAADAYIPCDYPILSSPCRRPGQDLTGRGR